MWTVITTLIAIFFIAYNEAKESKLEPWDLYISANFYERYDVMLAGEGYKVVVVEKKKPSGEMQVYSIITVPKNTWVMWVKFVIWIKY